MKLFYKMPRTSRSHSNPNSKLTDTIVEYDDAVKNFNTLTSFKKNVISELDEHYEKETIDHFVDNITKIQKALAESINNTLDLCVKDSLKGGKSRVHNKINKHKRTRRIRIDV